MISLLNQGHNKSSSNDPKDHKGTTDKSKTDKILPSQKGYLSTIGNTQCRMKSGNAHDEQVDNYVYEG